VGSAFGLISWAYLNCIWLTVVHNLGPAFDVQLTLLFRHLPPFPRLIITSVVSSSFPRAVSSEKIRAELAWANETPDPNKCGCRNLQCWEETRRLFWCRGYEVLDVSVGVLLCALP
jgi:hypothetical protein